MIAAKLLKDTDDLSKVYHQTRSGYYRIDPPGHCRVGPASLSYSSIWLESQLADTTADYRTSATPAT